MKRIKRVVAVFFVALAAFLLWVVPSAAQEDTSGKSGDDLKYQQTLQRGTRCARRLRCRLPESARSHRAGARSCRVPA